MCKYKEEVDKFLTVAANRRWSLKNDSKVDEHLSVYFADLFEDGATYNTASYTLFGYILLKSDSDQPERSLYPRARQALKGWSSKCPQSSRTGADPQIWFLLASYIADHSPPMAAALLLQLDTYTRPSEILSLRFRDVIRPVSKACCYWGIIIGNSEFGEKTKAGLQDDTVLLNSLDRTYAPDILKMVSKHCTGKSDLIFGHITLAQYEEAFRDASRSCGLQHFSFVPHSVRHSGPSIDFLHKSRTAEEIQTRGRWKAAKSTHRYQKPGQMLARMRKIPDHVWIEAKGALDRTMNKLRRFYGA